VPWWIYLATAGLAALTYLGVSRRWHHEGLEASLQDLTSADMAKARSEVWRLSNDPVDTAHPPQIDPQLVEHHFTVLWGLERTWIRRERLNREFGSFLFPSRSRRFDEAITPHVRECLKSCGLARELAAGPGSMVPFQDDETWQRVERLGTSLKLVSDGTLASTSRWRFVRLLRTTRGPGTRRELSTGG
jgi:hypothetical protein